MLLASLYDIDTCCNQFQTTYVLAAETGGGGRQGAYFSFRVFATDSSMLRCDAGHSEVVTASRAYICSFFFRI